MLTPKKTLKMSAKESEVMVFENGTVLGAVTMDCDTKSSYSAVNQDEPSPVEGCETCENSCCCASVSLLDAVGAGPLRMASVINSCEQIVEIGAHESAASDTLNSSACSRESRQSKRLRRKIRRLQQKADHLPPQYTAIYLDGGTGGTPGGGVTTAVNQQGIAPDSTHLQLPVPQRTDLEPRRRLHAGLFKIPSMPFVIGTLALGGVACTLGGIVLGSTGLIEQSTQYLSAALLMIGIGVSLLVISGAVWKLTVADEPDGCACCRHLDTCRNCNSVFCNNRYLAGSFIYPEFQHRTPPPSYVTSLNEFTVGLLLRDAANLPRCSAQIATPPPSYRSYSISSLSASGLVRHSMDSQIHERMTDSSMTSDKEPTYIEVE